MGKIKELYFRLEELISGLLFNDVTIEELDKYVEENVEPEEYQFYLENKQNLLDSVLTPDSENDDEWIDPAGGTHHGDDDEPWKMYESDDEEYMMPSLNEGCNCGGKKRPRPTIIRRPTNVVTLPTRKKLHESFFRYEDWKDSFSEEVTFNDTGAGVSAYKNKERVGWWDDRNEEGKNFENEIDENLNEVDYESMARMNRETDRAPRFVGGMSRYIAPKERKLTEKPEFDYSERKEGLGRIARKHRIMKDMGYDLDSEIEMPELAPTKMEFKRIKRLHPSRFKNVEPDKFSKLRGELGKEEREMNKFFKRHFKGKSLE